LHEELDEIPIVQEFKDIQVTVNNILQLVTKTIAREVTNQIIEDTGGDVLQGETGTKIYTD
ncbi:MAG TPA: YlbF family regulator, partial [Bacillota bacterium]|nr:YlbF family regulator [Bacillota bacterium]